MVPVQTVMESGNTVDVVDLVDSVVLTGSSSTSGSVEESHLFVEFIEGRFSETVSSILTVFFEGSSDESSPSLEGTFLEEHRSALLEFRWGDSTTLGEVTELPSFLLSGKSWLRSATGNSVSVGQ